ncbi:type VII secretion-associated serine protease mycosin [Streptomyces sp. MUM 178J]|uniref:type VII secretion-associated serine protease mycosin n=1 Tax=Streptomyces sp. MUM 178J TaxID=2791991 RepID=UPI0027E21B38|nr:type VII secretion-associated serine protease mycosin [Streptomyces sp. MUM 178J]WRQ81603.1 type VII secretion-associated serine protease mycosin [Streptomyces sp. MUM 178J]
MPVSTQQARGRALVSAVLGLVLAGVAITPAHAESIRSRQWHLDAMGAEEIWKISTGKGVTVAVIDSGVDAANGDLRGQVLEGLDLAPKSDGDEHTDYDGHGTGMAGLIAGTGESGGGDGAYGLAPDAKILPIRTPDSGWDANRDSRIREFNQVVPEGIRFAADEGAKVINISMKVLKGSPELTKAVKYAIDKGSLVFAGVGNDGNTALGYPAATPGVVGVGALDQNLKKTEESQYGPQVDISAPGWDMVHACGGKTGICKSSGTSDATAIASATAALIWSKHPEWTNNQVLRVILNTVSGPTSGSERNDHIGYGAVRPLRALQEPGDPGPADEYPLPDLAAAQSPSPAPDASKPAAGSQPDDSETEAAAPSADGGDDSNTGLWIGLGVGAAALIGAAVAFPVIRSRRRAQAVPVVAHNPYQQYPTHGQ